MIRIVTFYRLAAIEDVPCGYLYITTTDVNQLDNDINAAIKKYAKSEEASKQNYNIPVCKMLDLVNEKNKIEHVSFLGSNENCGCEEEDILMMHSGVFPILTSDCLCDRPNIPGIDFPKLLDTIRPMVVDVLSNDVRYVGLMRYVYTGEPIENHPFVDGILRRFGYLCQCVTKLKEAVNNDNLIITIFTDGTCKVTKPTVDGENSPSIYLNIYNYVYNGESESFDKEDYRSLFGRDIFMALCNLHPFGGLNAILIGTLYSVGINAGQHVGLWLKDIEIDGESITFKPNKSHIQNVTMANPEDENDSLYDYWNKYNVLKCDTFDSEKWMIK